MGKNIIFRIVDGIHWIFSFLGGIGLIVIGMNILRSIFLFVESIYQYIDPQPKLQTPIILLIPVFVVFYRGYKIDQLKKSFLDLPFPFNEFRMYGEHSIEFSLNNLRKSALISFFITLLLLIITAIIVSFIFKSKDAQENGSDLLGIVPFQTFSILNFLYKVLFTWKSLISIFIFLNLTYFFMLKNYFDEEWKEFNQIINFNRNNFINNLLKHCENKELMKSLLLESKVLTNRELNEILKNGESDI